MKKKKDILFLLQFFYPEYVSSATLPFDTAKKFAEAGFKVDALCGYPYEYYDGKPVPFNEEVDGVNIQRVKYLRLSRRKKLGRLINFFSLTVAMLLKLPTMRGYKTVFVYSNPPILPIVAAIASKLFGSKLVFVAYDLYPEIAIKTGNASEKGMITSCMNWINKIVYKQANAIVALSSEMKAYIGEHRAIELNKIHIIPNWCEDEFRNSNIERNLNRFYPETGDRFVVSYFGNMGVAQDMDVIEDAILFFKNDPNVCFLIAGHGVKQKYIKDLVKEESISNVYMYDFLKDDDYLDALSVSDCAIISLEKGLTGLCVPSKTYPYMMMGLPVLAVVGESDISRDMLKGAGYHIKNNSSGELISSIKDIASNDFARKAMGERSREIYLEKYTATKCLDKYVSLVELVELS